MRLQANSARPVAIAGGPRRRSASSSVPPLPAAAVPTGAHAAIHDGSEAKRAVGPSRSAFWLMAAVFFLLLFTSGAASPLYGVYQAEWGFSATTLTAVFAVYALTLLATLMFFGSLSDHLGRRRVIVAALGVNAIACGLFLAAQGVGALFAARGLQGVAVGLATGALGAALIELQPQGSGLGPLVTSSAPTMGLAVGALGTSALVQYAPAPTHLIWWLLLGGCGAGILAVLTTRESATVRAGVLASLRPRVGVPREARGSFAVAVPCLIAVWAFGAFYLSLGPSLAAELLGSHNRLWGGVVIFLLSGVGGVASILFRAAKPSTAMLGGCLVLIAGVAVTFTAIVTTTSVAFLLGTAVAGIGFGVAFLGAVRTVTALAAPDERAGMIAAVYIVNYLAFAIPVVIAGLATSRFGLHDTAQVYCAVIAALAVAAAGSLLFHGRTQPAKRGSAADPNNLCAGPCTVPPPSGRVVGAEGATS